MSRIEQIINEMEEYLDGCKAQAFSNSKRIVVEKDVIDDMLVELRMRTPEEIKKYQKIIANKDEILSEAKKTAENTIYEASKQKEEMVSQSEIMREAYAQAQQLMLDTEAKAQKLVNDATVEADEIRQNAMNYTDSLLSGLQDFLAHSMDNMQSRFGAFYNQMNASYQVVTANREELRSKVSDTDESGAPDAGESDGDNGEE